MPNVKYLSDKPEPADPLTVAIVAEDGAEYDNEAIGDDIWGEPTDVADDEEYDSLASCIWPACTMVGFDSIGDDWLEPMEPISVDALVQSVGAQALQKDLEKIDHVFLVTGPDSFLEIQSSDVLQYQQGHTIEFVEYESTES